ncbi:MAG TPA: DUF6519 domain-containing protein [Thermoanaerobaculia bacterium]|jgi:hypothetical protein
MKGDFSRRTFDRQRHFRSVRMQRGRVQLDADWNEQAEVLLHRLETLAADLIGPSGTLVEPMSYTLMKGGQPPTSGTGSVRTSGKTVFGFGTRFNSDVQNGDKITVGGQTRKVTGVPLTDSSLQVDQAFSPDLPFRNFMVSASGAGGSLMVAAGRYSVDGLLCELEADTPLKDVQPDLPGYALPTDAGFYLAYLDAWEEHVTALDDAGLADPALGGADTATRSQVVAQVKLANVADASGADDATPDLFPPGWNPGGDPVPPPVTLAARSAGTPLDNQLFRVEIHQGGGLGQATFKWSRDNGVAVAAITTIAGNDLTLASPPSPAPEKLFAAGQWVEVTSRAAGLRGEPGVLVRLLRVQGSVLTVESWPGPGGTAPAGVDRVRRWGSPGGGVPPEGVTVAVPADNDGYLALADGIEVRFAGTADAVVATGDYWLIPSRAAAGVLWPVDPDGEPAARQPDGIRHHYAPLYLFKLTGGSWAPVDGGDCRGLFAPVTELSGDAKVSRSGDTMTGALTIQSDLFVTGQARVGDFTTTPTPPAGVKLAVSGGALRVQQQTLGDSGLSFPSQGGSTASLRYQGTGLFVEVTDPSNAAQPASLRLFQNQADRMVFADGRVGIGVAEPTVNLDVGGLLRTQNLTVTRTLALVDGSQQAGLVLTASNSNGSASWQPVPQPAIFQPVFFDTPIDIDSSSTSSDIDQSTFSFGSALKPGTSAVILEASGAAGGPDTGAIDNCIRVRKDNDVNSPWLVVLRGRSAGSSDVAAWAGQAVCPVAKAGNDFQIQYSVKGFDGDPVSPNSAATGAAFDGGWSLRVVGYFLGE